MDLITKIENRTATIQIVGGGYVGLPLAVQLADLGFNVMVCDKDRSRVDAINRGQSYIPDVPQTRMPAVSARLSATAHVCNFRDVTIICVPTPLTKTRDPDNSYILQAIEEVSPHLYHGALLVLESTTYPGFTEAILGPLTARGVHVAFSPERTDPGNPKYRLGNTPKVIGGIDAASAAAARALYSTITECVMVSSPTAAEMVKLLENTYRAINIGLANEMALMCGRLGLDVWEIIEAAATKPYGFARFTPGPGLGGHCIPVDPQYLSWRMRTLGYESKLIAAAESINAAMPDHVVGRITTALNTQAKAVKGSHILLVGVAYKADVSDTRESPAYPIAQKLIDLGATVDYHDPHVNDFMGLSHAATLWAVANYTCVVALTAHTAIDWPSVIHRSQLFVDTRNVAKGCADKHITRL
jgi:UDP-N-acetyl-D-glucosamine dehydrogenase